MARTSRSERAAHQVVSTNARRAANALLVSLMLVVVVMLAGCAAMATSGAENPAWAEAASSPAMAAHPLILDRADLSIGTTVHFTRIPSPNEMRDLLVFPALAHVVLALPEWPRDYAALQVLNQAPEGPDVIVVLRGYPPTPTASDAWNQISGQIRLVMLVDGPPPSVAVITDLNRMRRLERVIAEMDEPRRVGFEHLQRPLSFRTFMR